MIGGTQDNGFVYYYKTTDRWYAYGGDGGDVVMHPKSEDKFYGIWGGTPWRKMGNTTGAWENIDNGISGNHPVSLIQFDRKESPIIYASAGNNTIYGSVDGGNKWNIFTSGDVDYFDFRSLAVSGGDNPKLYFSGLPKTDDVCLYSIDFAANDLYNRSKDLPCKTWDGSAIF